MSKRLEDFIKMNRGEFDDLEPSADLWARIEMHLPAQEPEQEKRGSRTFSLGFVLRVAASVIVVMGISFVFYVRNEKRGSIDFAAINPVYARQQVQYASQIETKRTELRSISKSDPQLYKEFSDEIAQMDSTYKELNTDLATSPNQERVLRAMIRNLQIQTQVLNQQLKVIREMNNMKKDGKDDVKDI
jgi:septal ring factor EnvC (AmiA/AmiB activator)